MIGIDTNILIYAVRAESKFHSAALTLISQLAEHSTPWAIPWPCAYEFLRVVTHPRVFSPPSEPEEAVATLETLRQSPSLVMLGDGPTHFRVMTSVLRTSGASGNLIHDAHIAAICIEHGVSELFTMDRDFARFPGLKVTRPFS